MQWGKSKTYIIIAFIVVNIVLLMSIFKEKTQYNYDFTKKNLNNLKTLLESKNIRYDMKLDTNTSLSESLLSESENGICGASPFFCPKTA